MKYSFTTARNKSLLSTVSKISLIFIFIVILVLLSFNFLLQFKSNSYRSQMEEFERNRLKTQEEIVNIENEIQFVELEKKIANEVFGANLLLKDSMRNLFDLVPDQIILNKAIMGKNSLILYGVTPTKDIFDFMLGSPLKSIFHTSNTIFYLEKDGRYRFVSTNEIIEEQ